MSKQLASVVVLKERLVNKIRSLQMPFFEESIYLIELEMEKKSRKELALDIRKERFELSK